jgi:hypothetical protein
MELLKYFTPSRACKEMIGLVLQAYEDRGIKWQEYRAFRLESRYSIQIIGIQPVIKP